MTNSIQTRKTTWGTLAFVGFALCVPTANWLIENVGTYCVPDGPCLVPVAPGLAAPSGVIVIGIALVLRDAVHRMLGVRFAFLAIILGAMLSFATASPGLVFASVAAFLLSEFLDLFVYTSLVKRGLAIAVLASGAFGAAMDSVVFIWLAFGNLEYVPGQIVGKLWASIIVALILARRSGFVASKP